MDISSLVNHFTNEFIYLDNAATTPCDTEVVEAMRPFWTDLFGNPSSPHRLGRLAKQIIEECREQIGRDLGGADGTIVFTSGATESNNIAVHSLVKNICERRTSIRRNKVLCLSTEHKSVLRPLEYMTYECKIDLIYIPVDRNGLLDLEWIERNIDETVGAVVVQLANSETGVIQDIKAVFNLAHLHNIMCFSDITQAVGRMNIDLNALGVDFASISAHKFYGPRGIGALYVARGLKVSPLMFGGGQEKDIRSGTENVAAIVGMTKALQLTKAKEEVEFEVLKNLRGMLYNGINSGHTTYWNGKGAPLLPTHLNITIPGVNAQDLLLRSWSIGFSAGSACNSIENTPSETLLRMSLTPLEAEQTIRLTLGRFNTKAQILLAISILSNYIGEILNGE